MIKYNLICKNCNNLFDSWFSSSHDYDKLNKNKYINCHNCNSTKITKNLMSPNILTSKVKLEIRLKEEKYKIIKKTMNEHQKFIKENFDYVGDNFAHEARSLHYKSKKKKKGIYGLASKQELQDLKDEGIKSEVIHWSKDTIN